MEYSVKETWFPEKETMAKFQERLINRYRNELCILCENYLSCSLDGFSRKLNSEKTIRCIHINEINSHNFEARCYVDKELKNV